MSKLKLKRPLNEEAVQRADDKFYAQHPEMTQRLDPNNPGHAGLLKEWRDDYLASGGQLEDTDLGGGKAGQVVAPCNGNAFLKVRITDCRNGKPLEAVSVEIAGPASLTLLTNAEGIADFGNVPPGDYYVWAEKAGLQNNTSYASVREGSPTVAEFCLNSSGVGYWVEFKYVLKGTEFPVNDSQPWTLVHPTGAREQGHLQSGVARRDGIPQGVYELRPQYLTGISWAPPTARSGEELAINVFGENIPDSSEVSIRIFLQEKTSGTPLKTLAATFSSGVAKASWKYVQQLRQPPFGRFVAVAKWTSKSAISDALILSPYPVNESKGLQQRLKHLGYYTGGIDGIVGPLTKTATRKFQHDHPPLVVDEIPGPLTCDMLGSITY